MDVDTFNQLLKQYEHVRGDHFETFLFDRKSKPSSSISGNAEGKSTEANHASKTSIPSPAKPESAPPVGGGRWNTIRQEFTRVLGEDAGLIAFKKFHKLYTEKMGTLTESQINSLIKETQRT